MDFKSAVRLWARTGTITRVESRRAIRGSDVIGIAVLVAVVSFFAGYLFGK